MQTSSSHISHISGRIACCNRCMKARSSPFARIPNLPLWGHLLDVIFILSKLDHNSAQVVTGAEDATAKVVQIETGKAPIDQLKSSLTTGQVLTIWSN